MKENHKKSLVLNADYSPMGIISWKRALVWSIRHEDDASMGVEVIDFYKDDYIMGTHNKKYPIPAVVKTAKYFRLHCSYSDGNSNVNFDHHQKTQIHFLKFVI
jgi:hypothetical protein